MGSLGNVDGWMEEIQSHEIYIYITSNRYRLYEFEHVILK